MTKLKLALVGTLMLIFGWMLPVSAATTHSEVQLSFTPATTTERLTEQIDQKIPTGQTPYQQTTPVSSKTTGDQLTGWLAKADNNGRLPQTGELSKIQAVVLGGMLLMVMALVGALIPLTRKGADERAH